MNRGHKCSWKRQTIGKKKNYALFGRIEKSSARKISKSEFFKIDHFEEYDMFLIKECNKNRSSLTLTDTLTPIPHAQRWAIRVEKSGVHGEHASGTPKAFPRNT